MREERETSEKAGEIASPSKLDNLSKNIDFLTKKLEVRELARKDKKIKRR